jgi:hypothetical protein
LIKQCQYFLYFCQERTNPQKVQINALSFYSFSQSPSISKYKVSCILSTMPTPYSIHHLSTFLNHLGWDSIIFVSTDAMLPPTFSQMHSLLILAYAYRFTPHPHFINIELMVSLDFRNQTSAPHRITTFVVAWEKFPLSLRNIFYHNYELKLVNFRHFSISFSQLITIELGKWPITIDT